jgi:demethylmenaquinone methyltransferase/2-methoxy-6-polyprenyl-1,4-benzoquinol methylase
MVAPESEKKIENMFDKIAPTYDLLNRLLSARQDERWRKKLLSWVPRIGGGSYLDVATGTGDVILRAKKSLSSYERFDAVDISSEMLSIAEKKSVAKGYDDITFKQMSAEKLRFEDDSFNCLSISFGLRNVVDKENAIGEFSRVLKRGGVLLVLEFFPPNRGLMSTLFQFYFNKILPVIGSIISDREAYHYLPKSVGSFYSLFDFKQKCKKEGLVVTDVKDYLFGSCRLVKAVKK